MAYVNRVRNVNYDIGNGKIESLVEWMIIAVSIIDYLKCMVSQIQIFERVVLPVNDGPGLCSVEQPAINVEFNIPVG